MNENPFLTGQDQHFGTRAPPRELQLENSVMPPDPGVVRVQVVYKFYKIKLALLAGNFDRSLLSCSIKDRLEYETLVEIRLKKRKKRSCSKS